MLKKLFGPALRQVRLIIAQELLAAAMSVAPDGSEMKKRIILFIVNELPQTLKD